MANTLQKFVLMIGFICLLQPAIAANLPTSKQIQVKNSLVDDAQERIEKFSAEIDAKEKEKKLIEMDIKRFSQEVKRLSLDTKPDDATKKALATAQFEVKRAEFNLEKNTAALKQLYSNRDKTREQKRIYSLQLEQLQTSGAATTPVVDIAAEKQAIEKARLAQLQKIKQQEAAEVEKQRKALQAKLGVKPVVPATKIPAPVAAVKKPANSALPNDVAKQKQAAAEKERVRLAELEKQKQLSAEKERMRVAELEKQKQLATEKERVRLAELEKQKQLATEKERAQLVELEKQKQLATEKERVRLAELEKQKQLVIDKERAALVAKEAEESAKQVQALAEKNRLAQLEQERLLREAKAQQAREQQANNNRLVTESSLNQALTPKGEPAKPLTPQQATQIKFLKSSTTLPPAESALTLAMARSLDAASEQPALGDHPDLEVANPIGSSPKTVGVMKYLGNNQYMLELRVAKGKQQFMLGEHRFVKNIPEHFDGIRCLLLVDARNKNNPTFQLVVAGN